MFAQTRTAGEPVTEVETWNFLAVESYRIKP
jgi:hypothetical protein